MRETTEVARQIFLDSSTNSKLMFLGTNSRAYGNLAHGVFDGTIETQKGIFHVEPAMRYVLPCDVHVTCMCRGHIGIGERRSIRQGFILFGI